MTENKVNHHDTVELDVVRDLDLGDIKSWLDEAGDFPLNTRVRFEYSSVFGHFVTKMYVRRSTPEEASDAGT